MLNIKQQTIFNYFGFQSFDLSYLMKVIPETSHAHKVGYLQFYYYYWVDTSAGGRLVPEGIIHPVIFFLKLTLFIRYIKV
jgi:hypothetical protein